jgi:hypothetical protein
MAFSSFSAVSISPADSKYRLRVLIRSCSAERSTVTRFQSSSDGISGYLLNPDLNGAGAALLEIQNPLVPGTRNLVYAKGDHRKKAVGIIIREES